MASPIFWLIIMLVPLAIAVWFFQWGSERKLLPEQRKIIRKVIPLSILIPATIIFVVFFGVIRSWFGLTDEFGFIIQTTAMFLLAIPVAIYRYKKVIEMDLPADFKLSYKRTEVLTWLLAFAVLIVLGFWTNSMWSQADYRVFKY